MKIPHRCKVGQERLICMIFKSLYGLKQAEKFWNITFIKFFQKISFISINADPYILTYWQDNIFIIIEVYIDNFALVFQNQDGLDWLKD